MIHDAAKEEAVGPQAAKETWQAWALPALLAGLSLSLFTEALWGWGYVDASTFLVGQDPLRPGPVGRLPFDWSPVRIHQPWDAWSWSRWLALDWPLWQPHEGLGHPLWANGQAAPLNPFKLLTGGALAGPGVAWFLVLRWLFGGVGVWLLARAWGLGLWGSALAAVAFAFQGSFLWHFQYPDLHAWVMLPWLAWLGWRLLTQAGPYWAGWTALALGFTAYLGHAEGAVFAALGALALAVGAWCGGLCSGSRPEGHLPAKPMLWAAFALFLGLGVAALAVWPFLELASHSHSYLQARQASALAEQEAAWPWWRVLLGLGRHAFGPLVWPDPWGFNAWVTTVALAFLPLGLRRGPTHLRGAFLAALGVGLLALLCLPPASLVAWPVPVPNAFYALPMVSVALALAGGAGFQLWVSQPNLRPAWLAWPALGLGALAGALAWGLARLEAGGGPAPLGGFALACGLAFLLLALAWRPAAWARPVALVLVLLAWGEGALAMRALHPPREGGYPSAHPAIEGLKALGPIRVAGAGGALAPNLPAALGLRSFGLMEAWMPPRLLAYWQAMGSHDGRVGTVLELQPGFSRPLARLAGLGAVVAPSGSAMDRGLRASGGGYRLAGEADGVAWFVGESAPRALVYHEVEWAPPGLPLAAQRLAESPERWAQVALVEAPPATRPPAWPRPGLAPSPVRWLQDDPQSLRMQVDLKAPGLLVLADQWDHGWQAWVDGVAVPIWPAQVAFRGLWLSAGAHEVQMSYMPRAFIQAFPLSLLAFFWAALLVWLGRRARVRGSAT